jgi:hypothetical protein
MFGLDLIYSLESLRVLLYSNRLDGYMLIFGVLSNGHT